jgi:hypothetical protein
MGEPRVEHGQEMVVSPFGPFLVPGFFILTVILIPEGCMTGCFGVSGDAGPDPCEPIDKPHDADVDIWEILDNVSGCLGGRCEDQGSRLQELQV